MSEDTDGMVGSHEFGTRGITRTGTVSTSAGEIVVALTGFAAGKGAAGAPRVAPQAPAPADEVPMPAEHQALVPEMSPPPLRRGPPVTTKYEWDPALMYQMLVEGGLSQFRPVMSAALQTHYYVIASGDDPPLIFVPLDGWRQVIDQYCEHLRLSVRAGFMHQHDEECVAQDPYLAPLLPLMGIA